MKVILSIAMIFFLFGAHAQLVVSDPNAQFRSVADFHGIKASGGIEILLTKASQPGAVVSNTINNNNDLIKTEVRNGILNIYAENLSIFRGKGRLKVYVGYTTLQSIKASGACDIKFADQLKADRFDIDISGACNLKGNIESEKLVVALSGASEIKITGTATELKLTCSGASDFKSPDFAVQSCVAEISGASDARLKVSESLKVNATGASNFYYSGTPAKTDITKSGASDVVRRN